MCFLLKQAKAPHPLHCEESKRFCDVFVPTCPDRPLGKPGFAVFVCSESLGTKNLTRRLYQSWAMLVTLSYLGWSCDKAGCNKNQHEPFQNVSPKVEIHGNPIIMNFRYIYIHYQHLTFSLCRDTPTCLTFCFWQENYPKSSCFPSSDRSHGEQSDWGI